MSRCPVPTPFDQQPLRPGDAVVTRVYLPATLATLAGAYVSGRFDAGCTAHAVTPAVREWYTEGGSEELEYVAFGEAAVASLRLLAAELAAEERYENRRVVVAADIAASCVEPVADAPGAAAAYRSRVRLGCTVALAQVVSVHVDGDEARSAVGDAVRAVPAADAGDQDAAFLLDEAESHELLWYDVSEVADLI
jgi:hypothetical protein